MEEPQLDETVNTTKDPAEAIKIIDHYKEITKTHNKKGINFVKK